VPITNKAQSIEIGRKLIDFHAANTVTAIRKAIANGGTRALAPAPATGDR
jgi:hypothetical protein